MVSFTSFFNSRKTVAANPGVDKPLTLQVLFRGDRDLETKHLQKSLRTYHRATRSAVCKEHQVADPTVNTDCLVGWQKHVIRLIGYNAPVPADAVRRCARPFFKSEEVKKTLTRHRRHLRLYYVGYDTNPFEQYVAMAVLGAVLADFGAEVIMNHSACTAFPVSYLTGNKTHTDKMTWLRSMPLPALYCGLVKYAGGHTPGIWMRTHGAYKLGLTDIAVVASRHQEKFHFDLINSVLTHQLVTGRSLEPGITHRVGRYITLRLREPDRHEAFLRSKNQVYVAEIVA
ncbi:MAG: hypothetical protein QNK37_15160 [Acidobacteriota bacterium]|nr:hypothetical protein [Acidobacteriota bacterium]